MLTTQTQVATRVVITSPCPKFGDLELDAILKLVELIRAQALIYADKQEELVHLHLEQSYEDIKEIFFLERDYTNTTAVIFITVWTLLFNH